MPASTACPQDPTPYRSSSSAKLSEPIFHGRRISVSTLFRRISLPAGLIALGGILLLSGFRVDDLTERLRVTGRWAPVLFVIIGVVSMSLMTPKTMVSLAAGALFGTRVGCGVMVVTAVAAAALNYSIGKHWIAAKGKRKALLSTDQPESLAETSEASWGTAIRQLARDAGFGLHLLVRLSPVPTTIISYSMGATKARFAPYIAAATVGVIPQFLYVHAASIATTADQSDRYRWISSILSLSVAVIVSIALPQIALRRLKSLRQSSRP